MSNDILAIDPGTTQSAYVRMRGDRITDFGIVPNEEMLEVIQLGWGATIAIEFIASFGMAVGKEIFETVFWIGRFWECGLTYRQRLVRVYRADVKTHLCHSQKANDASIRQALIDIYGPGKDVAIGTKKKMGPLYGISNDVWSALAIGVTAKHLTTGDMFPKQISGTSP